LAAHISGIVFICVILRDDSEIVFIPLAKFQALGLYGFHTQSMMHNWTLLDDCSLYGI
jgi:hypothetical protein